MLRIIFVLGGAKSGKSSFVLEKVSEIKGRKAFIATARELDDEMKERIKKHRAERGGEWENYEEPLNISEAVVDAAGRHCAVVLDCLTLWLTNVMISDQQSAVSDQRTDRAQTTEAAMTEFINALKGLKDSPAGASGGDSSLYIVSNEVGMGIVPENSLAREFREFAGSLNQKVAGIADEVYLVTAGIPVKIKPN